MGEQQRPARDAVAGVWVQGMHLNDAQPRVGARQRLAQLLGVGRERLHLGRDAGRCLETTTRERLKILAPRP